MDTSTSGYISDFLDFIRATEEAIQMATEDLNECNEILTDLSHYIEFGSPSGPKMMKVYKRYHETRKKRRRAKETLEVLEPVQEWAINNKSAIRTIETLLGRTRKIENLQGNRVYAVRTHILDDITDHKHLRDRSGDDGVN